MESSLQLLTASEFHLRGDVDRLSSTAGELGDMVAGGG